MYGSKWHWMHKTPEVTAVMELFKTLVRFGIVGGIVHPGEWTIWYGEVKRFAYKYENRK